MNFDYQELTERLERVYSRRLALRPLSLADGWPLFQATRNPQFNKHLLWDQPHDERQVLERIDMIVEEARRGRMTALSAVVRETGEWAALFRFLPHATEPLDVEMGLWMHDRFWHGRYAFELTRMCIDATFELSPATRLLGVSTFDNRASIFLMRQLGMSPTVQTTRYTETGAALPLQQFELTRNDWLAKPSAQTFSAFDIDGRDEMPAGSACADEEMAAA